MFKDAMILCLSVVGGFCQSSQAAQMTFASSQISGDNPWKFWEALKNPENDPTFSGPTATSFRDAPLGAAHQELGTSPQLIEHALVFHGGGVTRNLFAAGQVP